MKIIERALAERNIVHRLTVVPDGRQALDYVHRLTSPEARLEDFPDLVLLDLNLPGIDGFEVLTQLKSDPALRAIPVVVLTTSRLEADVLKTYRHGANTYIQKPSEFPRYCDLVATLRSYWQDTAVRSPIDRPEE